MRKTLIAAFLIAGVEAAALACSSIMPAGPEQSRASARDAVRGAFAIVEVDVLSGYRPTGRGEQVRVRRVLFGQAPRTFRIARGPFASDASCDLLLTPGRRKVLILHRDARGGIAMQGLRSDYLTAEAYLPVTLAEARKASGRAR